MVNGELTKLKIRINDIAARLFRKKISPIDSISLNSSLRKFILRRQNENRTADSPSFERAVFFIASTLSDKIL
jgi:hypothetical protein